MNLFRRYLDDANVAAENISFVIFDVNLISIFIHMLKFYIITTNNEWPIKNIKNISVRRLCSHLTVIYFCIILTVNDLKIKTQINDTLA